jgi:hypothetical protein
MRKLPTGKWNFLALLLSGVPLLGLFAWIVLLSTICRSPASPDVNHHITFSCHGSIVYIAQLQQLLLVWVIPGWLLLGYIAMQVKRRASRESLNK